MDNLSNQGKLYVLLQVFSVQRRTLEIMKIQFSQPSDCCLHFFQKTRTITEYSFPEILIANPGSLFHIVKVPLKYQLYNNNNNNNNDFI